MEFKTHLKVTVYPKNMDLYSTQSNIIGTFKVLLNCTDKIEDISVELVKLEGTVISKVGDKPYVQYLLGGKEGYITIRHTGEELTAWAKSYHINNTAKFSKNGGFEITSLTFEEGEELLTIS